MRSGLRPVGWGMGSERDGEGFRLRDLWLVPLSAGLILAGAQAAAWCAVPPAALTIWRPEAGLGLGLLLCFAGWRRWALVTLGVFGGQVLGALVQFSGREWISSYVVVASLEPLAMALLLRLALGRGRGIWGLRGAAGLVTVAVVVSALGTMAWLASIFGTVFPPGSDARLAMAAAIQSLGMALGVLVSAPLVVAVVEGVRARRVSRGAVEMAGLLIGGGVVCALVLGVTPANPAIALGMLTLPLPILFWAAVRRGLAGAAGVGLVLVVSTALSLRQGTGPLMVLSESVSARLLGAQWAAITAIAAAGLVAGAAYSARQVQHLLRMSEEKYRLLFDESPDALLVIGGPGARVLDANLAASAILGRARSALIGRELREVTGGDGEGSLAHALSVPRARAVPAVRRRADGAVVHLSCGTTAVMFEGREATLARIEDVTESVEREEARRRAEAQLADVRRMESIGMLAAGLAHDFSNILVGILGGATAAQRLTPPGTEAHRMVTTISRSAQRGAEMVKQLLATAGRTRENPRLLDLSSVVRDAVEAVHSSGRGHVRMTLAPDLVPVLADEPQMARVVTNLLHNALEAAEGDEDGVEVRTYQQGAPDGGVVVCLEVRDTGPGIPAELLPRVFEPFVSSKGPGRGLGLSAALGIIRACGGTIEAESELGAGARFRVELPGVTGPAPSHGAT